MTRTAFFPFLFSVVLGASGCRSGDQTLFDESSADDDSSPDSGQGTSDNEDSSQDSIVRGENWDDVSHSNDVEPDFETVFPTSELLRMEITIEATQWAAMQSDLAANLSVNVGGPGGPGAMGSTDLDFTPVWGEADIAFGEDTWEHVGIRYKGNSTLMSAYQSGTDAFPFKLDFDEWEDSYPQIDDQRFFGFKQLNLGRPLNDDSFMRERIAADLFREFGVPAAHVSFCEVYLDRGNGLNFVGLYSLVEEVDDTVIENQFFDSSGNLYKPESDGATFASGTYNDEDMQLKTNEDQPDYTDVFGLYELLHDESRASDLDTWSADLESRFYVDGYLRYLAVNQVIQNWDTYGNMTHNFFLYNDEGMLTWIPWDNNESLQEGRRLLPLSLGLGEVGDDWPIIRHLMDVPAYEATYRSYVEEFAAGAFTESRMSTIITEHAELIEEAANRETNDFDAAVANLVSHVEARQAAVTEFLQ